MNDQNFNGLVYFTFFFLNWELIRRSRLYWHYEKAFWSERKGRKRIEDERKQLLEIQLNSSEGFYVQPIGLIQSCFRQCIGTPRQGLLVPSSRASVKLSKNISPEAFDGLEEYSHVWITFQFHLNSNICKEVKAFHNQKSSTRFTFKAKITPPMLKEKKGVFATRSPHRPNPIGVTLAKIDRVDKSSRCLYLSACDLVQDTPVLDIKPYVPAYDNVSPYFIPDWITSSIGTRNAIIIDKTVREDVFRIQSKLKQFKDSSEKFLDAVIETLEADVRSKFQTNRRIKDSSRGVLVYLPFDEALIEYLWLEDRVIQIIRVLLLREAMADKKNEGINIYSNLQRQFDDSNAEDLN